MIGIGIQRTASSILNFKYNLSNLEFHYLIILKIMVITVLFKLFRL